MNIKDVAIIKINGVAEPVFFIIFSPMFISVKYLEIVYKLSLSILIFIKESTT